MKKYYIVYKYELYDRSKMLIETFLTENPSKFKDEGLISYTIEGPLVIK